MSRLATRLREIVLPVWLLYFCAAGIGLAVLFYFYPPNFIFGNGKGFYFGDLAANVAGYYAFRDTPWHFPIFLVTQMNYPEGISIINTDSIPLIALVIKPFAPLLPVDFHFYRLWYMATFLLQAVSAVFLIRQMGHKGWLSGLLAATFAMFSPVFIIRSGHASLTTQAIILFALGLYFQAKRREGCLPRAWYAAWFALIGSSFLIHPYFTAMILPIYWAALFDRGFGRASWFRLLGSSSAPLGLLLLLYFLFWHIPNSSAAGSDFGYGNYSLNLLGPIVGGSLLPWSQRFRGVRDGQGFEGYNYLGLGTLLLVLLGLIIYRKRLMGLLWRHKFLILLLLAFTIFALSNKIYIARRLIYEYPPYLTKIVGLAANLFRCTGRFFWPVGYGILFTALSGAFSFEKRKLALVAVFGLAVVQWIDIPKMNYDYFFVRTEMNTEEKIPSQTWNRLLAGKRELFITPAWTCGADPFDTSTLQLLAMQNRVLINTAYGSRQKINCEQKRANALAHIQAGTVHYFEGGTTAEQVKEWVGPNAPEWCRSYNKGFLCVPHPTSGDRTLLDSDPVFGRFE